MKCSLSRPGFEVVFYIIGNIKKSVPTLLIRILTSFSVDGIFLPRFMNWFTNLRVSFFFHGRRLNSFPRVAKIYINQHSVNLDVALRI